MGCVNVFSGGASLSLLEFLLSIGAAAPLMGPGTHPAAGALLQRVGLLPRAALPSPGNKKADGTIVPSAPFSSSAPPFGNRSMFLCIRHHTAPHVYDFYRAIGSRQYLRPVALGQDRFNSPDHGLCHRNHPVCIAGTIVPHYLGDCNPFSPVSGCIPAFSRTFRAKRHRRFTPAGGHGKMKPQKAGASARQTSEEDGS